jgi:hypothetical protein
MADLCYIVCAAQHAQSTCRVVASRMSACSVRTPTHGNGTGEIARIRHTPAAVIRSRLGIQKKKCNSNSSDVTTGNLNAHKIATTACRGRLQKTCYVTYIDYQIRAENVPHAPSGLVGAAEASEGHAPEAAIVQACEARVVVRAAGGEVGVASDTTRLAIGQPAHAIT